MICRVLDTLRDGLHSVENNILFQAIFADIRKWSKPKVIIAATCGLE